MVLICTLAHLAHTNKVHDGGNYEFIRLKIFYVGEATDQIDFLQLLYFSTILNV